MHLSENSVLKIFRGEVALAAVQKVLAMPELDGLELFSFKAHGTRKRLDIRLDKVLIQGLCFGQSKQSALLYLAVV